MWPGGRENFIFGIGQLFWKNVHEMSYHLRSFMAFRSNGVGYGQRACIVCRNGAISRTCMYTGMGINGIRWSHRILRRLSAMSLEPGHIWTMHPLLPAPNFLEKSFLDPERVIWCAFIFRFRISTNRCTTMLDVVKQDVWCVPFWAKLHKMRNCETFLRRHFIWPSGGKF
jgi:hypothetical protein